MPPAASCTKTGTASPSSSGCAGGGDGCNVAGPRDNPAGRPRDGAGVAGTGGARRCVPSAQRVRGCRTRS
eukprot:4113077-Lingulodinium_polyedra.AAC.1